MAMMRNGTVVSRPACPVEVVDTVGAGDSFHSALLAYLDQTGRLTPGAVGSLTPAELSDALDFAACAAAITCTRRGADSPTWIEVDERMGTASRSGRDLRPDAC
jgi:fructokinase